MSAPPFFIVGCGRSGTSLLRDMLNSHSKLAVPLESLFIIDYLRAGKRLPRNEMLDLMLREPELREWGLRPRRSDFREVFTPVQAIEKLHRLYADAHGKERWGQKTPRLVRHLNLLLESFPGSRFIHLVRDPRAVTSSLVHSDVHRSTAWYAAHRWAMDVEAGLAFEKIHPDHVLQVRYEDLARKPERILRRVADFIGVAFEPGMLEVRRGRSEYSPFYAGIHANLDRPPTEEFVDRWKSRLTANQVAIVGQVDGALARTLGYDIGTDHGPVELTHHPWRTRASRVPGTLRQALRYLQLRRAYLIHLIRRKRRLGLLGEFLCSVNY